MYICVGSHSQFRAFAQAARADFGSVDAGNGYFSTCLMWEWYLCVLVTMCRRGGLKTVSVTKPSWR